MMRLVEGEGWPIEEYRSLCATLGREVVWEPQGRGTAIDLTGEGGLVVESGGYLETLSSGAIRHLRG
jgi:hypothetical protein